MCVINTDAEKEKLACMFEGDRARDASSSIRGFLYQDYVVINYLLENDVEYVCSEYLEDVDVFYRDNRFEFIQVKYYPKSPPKMEEITTDLYYQYLRLRMLDSGLKAIPTLYVHSKDAAQKLSADDMRERMKYKREDPEAKIRWKKIVPIYGKLRDTAEYPDAADVRDWLKQNVHFKQEPGKEDKARSKDDQKDSLFSEMAATDSLEAFLRDLVIIERREDIEGYKEYLMKRLAQAFQNPDKDGDEKNWQLILLGLALSRIQERYLSDGLDFDRLRLGKDEFIAHMERSIQTKTNLTIASYLVGAVAEVYEEIIQCNDLSELQTKLLDQISRKTIHWIGKVAQTLEGQYQLLNTFSTDEASKVAGYTQLDIGARLIKIAESKSGFSCFLKYLWKIMLNICQDKIKTLEEINNDPDLFDPEHYLVKSVTDYVCLKFPEDVAIAYSVILPRAGSEFKGMKRKIVGRTVNMSPRPEKWLLETHKIPRGKNYYNYSTADVIENPNVADLGKDTFYIECMDCIGIDEGEWCEREACSECIFSMKCVKERT